MTKHIAPTRRANHPLAAEPNGSKASPYRLRKKSNFLKHFKLILAVQSCAKKYFASRRPQISGFIALSRLIEEGRTRRHERGGGMRWTRQCREDERRCSRKAKSCGPGAPMQALRS